MRITVICIQPAYFVHNVLVLLELGYKTMFEFFRQ